eukprot:COSAG06_NODE_3470_length_5297_cov_18.285879_5_plen_45_part_00
MQSDQYKPPRIKSTSGTRGWVVLIVGGEATTFDSAGSEATFVVQ